MKIIKFIKEKILYFFLGGVCLASVGSQMLPAKVPTFASLQSEYARSSIQGKYKMQNASFIREAKDENAIQIEVGDKIKQEFVPSMKIAKWENEVSMRVSPKTNSKSKKKDFVIEGEKIKYKEDKKEFHFYEIEDGYEVEVILLEKPKTNIVEMEIETDGLDFFYQPELTQQEIDDGCFRPENVIGSYAVYHSTKSNHILGQKNYQSGKAFHIFRPLIIDNLGAEVWGSLNIDIENKLLTVEIPQEFLDGASYPVIVDPTFGYLTEGTAGYQSISVDDACGSLFTSPADISTVEDIRACTNNAFTKYWKGFIVLHSNLNIVANAISPAVESTSTKTFRTGTFSTPPTLSPSTEYVLLIISNANSISLYYDSGDTDQGHYDGSNEYDSPVNLGLASHTDRKYSIYATYTTGGEEEAPAKKQDVVWFE